jgi:glucose-6-phosphate dehydrogenase assembly protein OpcA
LADSVTAQVPAVVAVHPARVLLVIAEPTTATDDVKATVCARPIESGRHRQSCTEQVTLHAAGAAVDRLPFAVRSLLIGDLPTNLWWASIQPPPMAGAMLHELAEHAQQIIFDSIGWQEPARAVALTAPWLDQIEHDRTSTHWRVASDLNWRRLKYWRRLLAQALDPNSAPGAIETIREVLIEHGPHAVVQAWELASWLAQRLGWRVLTGRVQPGVELGWRFQAEHGDLRVRIKRWEQGPPEIRHVRIACTLDDKPAALNCYVESEQRLAVHHEGEEKAARTLSVPPLSLAELVARQLSDREHDPIYQQSMAVAQILARSLLR